MRFLPLLICIITIAAAPPVRGAASWRNLVRNPGFEEPGNEECPAGWHWSSGKANALLAHDGSISHSGSRSIKLTNPTPREPNVFGCLWQTVAVRPNRTYTLSCYVRTADAGAAWIGGGTRWQHRFPLPRKAMDWTRVTGTFKTDTNERAFTVRILTESPTRALWIDAVMLEEGATATAFASDRALQAGDTVLNVEPVKGEENLLPNSSFEQRDGTRPKHWIFNKRNTDATLSVTNDVVHSGRNALYIANNTAFGSHVYGMVTLQKRVAVSPNTTYTISAFVRSENPGRAWIGGGTGWRLRCPVRKTGDEWLRISDTFVTGEDETAIPILIVTESPTAGFRIDDVKLEQGGYTTPYVPPEGVTRADLQLTVRPARAVLSQQGWVTPQWAPSRYPPDETVFLGNEMWLDGLLMVPADLPAARVTVRLTGRDGALHAERTEAVDLTAGGNRIEFGCGTAVIPGTTTRATCRAVDADGRPVAERELPLTVFTARHATNKLATVSTLLADLRAHLPALRARGQASRALATTTVLEHFIDYAQDDIRQGEIGRAYDAARTMKTMAEARLDEVRSVLRDRQPRWRNSLYATSPITIDGPSFVANAVDSVSGKRERKPVFFAGYGHFGAVRRDIEVFPRYGANLIQIEFGPRSVLVAEDTVSERAIEEFLAVCDRAAEANVAVNLLLSPHYFPKWALAKWPHLEHFKGGFLGFDIYAPEAKAIIERSLRIVIPRIKDHPALHSLCLSNEPLCVDLSKSVHGRALWHTWLRERYGSVTAMNAAWGTTFARVADVPVRRAFDGEPATYDFVRFNQEQFAAWHRWMADIIHDMAPAIPVHAKIMMGAHWNRNPHGIWSVSPELFGSLSQVHGNDCWKYPSRGGGEWIGSWLQENMAYDFQRSMGDKPVFNSENHLIPDRDTDVVRPEWISNVIWQGAVHGMSATTTWVWERTFDPSAGAAGSIMHRPDCTEAQNLACLDLNRLSREVTALQRLAPKVVLLSSLPSTIYADDHFRCLKDVYTAFNFCGIPLGFVTDRQLAAWLATGRRPFGMREARVLVVPRAVAGSDTTVRAIGKLAGEGMTVVTVGEHFTRNEHNRARQPAPTLDSVAWSSASARDLWPACLAMVRDADITPCVQLTDTAGHPVWGVETRAVPLEDGRLIINLANYLKTPLHGLRLVLGDEAVGGTDLMSLQPVQPPFDLPAAKPLLIAVSP